MQTGDLMVGDLYIVANRLPVTKTQQGYETSPGGLVSALFPVAQRFKATWIGWSGTPTSTPEHISDTVDSDADTPENYRGVSLLEVALSTETLAGFYYGFANSFLWPLAHGRADLASEVTSAELKKWWIEYDRMNRLFAQKVATVATANAIVWVHDYHLLLVPKYLSELRPDLRVGLFLHTPAISEPVMKSIGEGFAAECLQEIAEGLAAADLVGVQTREDQNDLLQVFGVAAQVFPISIDPTLFSSPSDAAPLTNAASFSGRAKTYLGVDRLDYAKGIPERLRAFKRALEENLDFHPFLLQFLVPTREGVPAYVRLREEVEQLSSEINDLFQKRYMSVYGEGFKPVVNHFTSLDQQDLVSVYRACDVMLVSSIRDGMNLVAKEFVASRIDGDGVLLLSTHAGATAELQGQTLGAVVFDPLDEQDFAQKILQADAMPAGERRARITFMREQIESNTAADWANSFLRALSQA